MKRATPMTRARGVRAAGFTLVEMLVVAAMMSILALAVLPLAEVAQTRAKERELRAALRDIRKAIDAYKQAHDEAMAQRPLQPVAASGYPPHLQALVEGFHPSQPLLRRIPRDPFAPEGVGAAESWGLRSYASPAHAPRPGADVYDVYSRSSRMGSNGVPLSQW